MKSRLIIVLLHLLALLPLRTSRALARPLAWFCRAGNSRMYRVTLINLGLCFPDKDPEELKRLAAESLRHTMQTILESGAVWLWPPERTLRLITEVDGGHLLREAHARGKGVIVLAPHLGNWEVLGLYLNTCGLGQSYQLYQAPDDARLNALILHARSRAGAKMVATDSKGVGELLKALKSGCIAGILPDQVPPEESGVFAPFFGVDALTMTLLIRLQQKTGAEVLIAWAGRNEKGGFTLVFRKPDEQIYAGDMPTAAAGMNRSIEQAVREAPAQYQWEYKRFKRRPEGRPRLY